MDLDKLLRQVFDAFSEQSDQALNSFEKELSDERSIVVFIQTLQIMNADHSSNFGTRIQGSVEVCGDLQNAFNTVQTFTDSGTDDSLSKALKELAHVVSDLTSELAPDAARRASRDFDQFVKEAIDPKPRKPVYDVSAKGLIEAAGTVAHLAGPIADAVEKVLVLLS